jgi:hypothetical protein
MALRNVFYACQGRSIETGEDAEHVLSCRGCCAQLEVGKILRRHYSYRHEYDLSEEEVESIRQDIVQYGIDQLGMDDDSAEMSGEIVAYSLGDHFEPDWGEVPASVIATILHYDRLVGRLKKATRDSRRTIGKDG